MIIDSKLIHESNKNLIKQLASLFKVQFFYENEIVIKQNDICDNFFLICEGIVEVAQEKVDFIYFDYQKKNKFMKKQIRNSNNRRKRLSNRHDKRRAGMVGKELINFNRPGVEEDENEEET